MSTDIFLSYASEDRNIARVFVDALQKEGFTVWWDRAIQPGSSFERVIDQAIASTRCVVVLWSESSVLSDWVSNEALEGLERGILVPVLIQRVRIPVAFRGIQASVLDEFPARAEPGELANFYVAVRETLQRQPEGDAAPQIRSLDNRGRRHGTDSGGRTARGAVAVLPFENLSGVEDNDYICDGLADELRIGLAKVPGLVVASRSASAQAAADSSDVRIAGQSLEAEQVIEGRMRRFGRGLRLTVEVTSVQDGYQNWSHSVSVTEETLLEDSEELIVAAKNELGAASDTQFGEEGYKPNAEAYQEYLRGRFFFNSADTRNRNQAIVHFKRAVELDDGFVAAYCGLTNAYLLRHIGSNDPVSPEKTFSNAREAGLRAYQLDPKDAASLGAMGSLYLYDWQWEKSKEFLRRSLEIDPTDTMVRHSWATLLNYEGRTKEAAAFMEETLRFEPLSPIAVNGTARILRYLGRFSDAHEICSRLLSAMPNSLAAIEEMAESAFMAQDYEKGAALVEQERDHLGDDHPTIIWHRARLALGAGDAESFSKHFNHLKLVARNSYVTSSVIAFCYMMMGKHDRALDYLEIGVREKDPWLVDIAFLPLSRKLTSTDRYKAIVDAVKNSPPQIS
ncbi:MAG: TIR domain-containing protein [Halioglobus sp.]